MKKAISCTLALILAMLLFGCGREVEKFEIRFTCGEQITELTLKKDGTVISPIKGETAVFLLEAGEYTYDYSCENCVPVRNAALTVSGAAEIVLEPVPFEPAIDDIGTPQAG